VSIPADYLKEIPRELILERLYKVLVPVCEIITDVVAVV
jgi:hypothetical protein